ncbi:hypothetical protein B484DRAFT_424715 [Ochromonadaceae sp. CCMP2298]|nr:hypothetical protein B484DRAFT_424715 [Ochromonadaceae sp. CCMP2298]|mmetsp:Transcript_28157/g.62995  ORF Transcript_28157/g.62995 Transcript_28157/m.62995 type:complete len:240 (-) Transcript_28157:51-770(-)
MLGRSLFSGGRVLMPRHALRQFSTQPVVAIKEPVVMITNLNTIQNPSEYLHHLRFKGRKSNPKMAIRHLRNLLLLCDVASLDVAQAGIKFYHYKRSDFSQEVCSRFINLCVAAEQPAVATAVLLQPGHRLGAWLSQKSMKTLLAGLGKGEGDVATMLAVAELAVRKGLKVQTSDSLETLLKATAEAGDEEAYARAVGVADADGRWPDVVAALKAKYTIGGEAEEEIEIAEEEGGEEKKE